MNRTIGAAFAALALTLCACGSSPASGSDRGATEVLDMLDTAVESLTEAAAPGTDTSDFVTETLPCTDSASPDRIMYRTTARDLRSEDTGKSLQQLEKEIQRLGMAVELDRAIPAQEIGFWGNGLRGSVVVKTTGTVNIVATTDCHDKP